MEEEDDVDSFRADGFLRRLKDKKVVVVLVLVLAKGVVVVRGDWIALNVNFQGICQRQQERNAKMVTLRNVPHVMMLTSPKGKVLDSIVTTVKRVLIYQLHPAVMVKRSKTPALVFSIWNDWVCVVVVVQHGGGGKELLFFSPPTRNDTMRRQNV